MTRKTFKARLACFTTAVLLSIGAAHEALGQATYERRRIVEVNETAPRRLELDEVPINFTVPKPDDLAGDYRSLQAIRSILDNRGGVGAIESATLGQSRAGRPGPLGRIPSQQITQVTVRARVQFKSAPGRPLRERPDGTPKGRALVVGGVHSREWAAIESILRKLEAFQSPAAGAFEERLVVLRDEAAPGTRDVFFAENLQISFVPVLNPGSLQASQAHFGECFMLTNSSVAGPTGQLRDGRIRRKNLQDTDGIMLGLNQISDTDALFGVDLNRNMTDRTNGSPDRANITYIGSAANLHTREPETQALHGLLTRITQSRLSGIAFLDLHTQFGPVGAVVLPEARVTAPDAAEDFADRVSIEFNGTPAMENVLGAALFALGTTDDMALVDFSIPAITVELPEEPDIDRLYLPRANTFDTTTGGSITFEDSTRGSLKFLVDPAKLQATATRAAQVIDSVLEWAAGPAYVREVLFLQDRNADGLYALPDAENEVLYFTRLEPVSEFVRAPADLAPDPGKARWINSTAPAKVVIVFSKPMPTATNDLLELALVDSAGATVLDLRTQPGGGISDPATSGWQVTGLMKQDLAGTPASIGPLGAKRYEGDTWVGTFTLPQTVTFKAGRHDLRLRVSAEDPLGRELDGDPTSVVEWDPRREQLVGYELGADELHSDLSIDTVGPKLRRRP